MPRRNPYIYKDRPEIVYRHETDPSEAFYEAVKAMRFEDMFANFPEVRLRLVSPTRAGVTHHFNRGRLKVVKNTSITHHVFTLYSLLNLYADCKADKQVLPRPLKEAGRLLIREFMTLLKPHQAALLICAFKVDKRRAMARSVQIPVLQV